MEKILLVVVIVASLFSVQAEDNVQVDYAIKLGLTPRSQSNLVEKSVALLSSCAYMDKHLPQKIEDVKKQSHLDFKFNSPRIVDVPIMKTTVKIKEMVISLPLIIGGIWVRTDDGDIYFSKFQFSNVQDVNKILTDSQRL
jgi:hypothetical protein